MNNKFKENTYIVAGNRPWNKQPFLEKLQVLPGKWKFAGNLEELHKLIHECHNPRYIFFLHWSHQVPPELHQKYECVCFHMTDVPYGRGGSPLQNLIQRGHRYTKLTALRMVHELDAGPVYSKKTLSLEGSAEEIYIRAGYLSAEIISEIILHEPSPVNQEGAPVVFKRRKPEQSAIPKELASLFEWQDFIRMLDAEGYPHAFIDHGKFRLEFTRSSRLGDSVVADVKITALPQNS